MRLKSGACPLAGNPTKYATLGRHLSSPNPPSTAAGVREPQLSVALRTMATMSLSFGLPSAASPVSPGTSGVECDINRLVHDIFDFTPVPTVVLDASLTVRHVSASYGTVSGACDHVTFVGSSADSFFGRRGAFSAFVSAAHLARCAQERRSVQQFKSLDAGRAWEIRAVPIIRHGCLRCIHMEFFDITREHQRQLELEESLYANETFRILVETVKDYAIFMLDPRGYVATWNAGAQAFKGYTKSEIVGKHFSNFYGQEDRENDKPGRELKDALRDGRCEDEGWRYRKDGSRFWANVVITPVYKDDVLLGFSKVTRDLTERRKAENSLIAAYEESSKLKSEFLANMSHEIRTPMHGMLAALTLLKDTKLNHNQLELAGIMKESGDVLLHVINDILDYSKLASGNFTVSRDLINVAEIIQSVFRAHQACHAQQVRLESVLDPRLPKAVEGDAVRYKQIVQNLLSNASKFTEEGYIRIASRPYAEEEEYITILSEVIDSGIGVPANGASSLFTPFTQFDNSATKRYKGTGLGLSICKSLAELMGGQIGFHPNSEGRGSIFWFTAKLKKCKHMETVSMLIGDGEGSALPSPTLIDPLETVRRFAAGKRLLLAEDNVINQKIMLKMLNGLGFIEVDTAVDGREAVDKAAPGANPYDLILMDVNMPVQDGVSATKELREKGSHTPIIAMTANALKGQAEGYLAKGMTAYVPKPVDRTLFAKVLAKHLKLSEHG
ncbi:hypothetical protein ACN47E_003398 [Coniothyrium glycines]